MFSKPTNVGTKGDFMAPFTIMVIVLSLPLNYAHCHNNGYHYNHQHHSKHHTNHYSRDEGCIGITLPPLPCK